MKIFRRISLAVALGGLMWAGPAAGFEAAGRIESLDAGSRHLRIEVNGRTHAVAIAADAQVLGADDKPLADGLRAKEFKAGAEVSITVEKTAGGPVVRVLRLGRRDGRRAAPGGKTSVGLQPLDQMGAADRYQGEDGGLYGGGRNAPPPAHLAAARQQTALIVPRAADGRPDPDGKIGLIALSMSNATQEYSLFKQLADRDPQKSPRVVIVDCAQGGQAMAEWARPDAQAWREADRRLEQAGVSARQVQVLWVKLANKGPRGGLSEHVPKLERDTRTMLQLARARFPNARLAYLGSRIYGGYAASPLNPEPYAYEGAFAVRGLILAQARGDPELRYDDARGPAKVPLLLWGPYFWADGTVPRRSDGLTWERRDLGGDGTHPSESGRRKVADMLLKFFKADPLAVAWFLKKPAE